MARTIRVRDSGTSAASALSIRSAALVSRIR
jgi:hypothetical protein